MKGLLLVPIVVGVFPGSVSNPRLSEEWNILVGTWPLAQTRNGESEEWTKYRGQGISSNEMNETFLVLPLQCVSPVTAVVSCIYTIIPVGTIASRHLPRKTPERVPRGGREGSDHH